MLNLKLLTEDLQDLTVRPQDTRRRALLKVEGLQREAQRLQSLFDEFLSLTGPCRLKRAPTDLNAVVARLTQFFAPEAVAHKIELMVVPTQEPMRCPVDEQLLGQALLNIMINARQAMPKGGKLRLAVTEDGDSAVISVSDTGVGIEEKDIERIFRPFFSTKVSGCGLGLSITQRIVHEHGGTLTCESEVGKGTTFTIRLPLHPNDSPAS